MRLVILGRDGVINAIPESGCVTEPALWHPLPGSLRAIARLCRGGFRVVVVTNQPGLAQGRLDLGMLNSVHDAMRWAVEAEGGHIDAVFYCPHDDAAQCDCRKPRPGLLLDLGRRLDLELAGIPLVGDDLEDVEAARAVGARPILVRSGRGREASRHLAGDAGVVVVDDLAAAADLLLEEGR